MSAKRVNPLSSINWDYIHNKVKRAKATFVITAEKCFYLQDGNEVNENAFESMYPVEIVSVNPKGNNPDKTHVK